MNKISAKEKLLRTASILFYNDGIFNTGINLITDKARVAKMSLYNNYSTKSDLVRDYINSNINEWTSLYKKKESLISSPIEGVVAVFDTYIDLPNILLYKDYKGCGLLNAAVELEINSHERLLIKLHKENIDKILEKHISNIFQEDKEVKKLSHLVSYILEGAIIKSGLDGNVERINEAKFLSIQILIGNF